MLRMCDVIQMLEVSNTLSEFRRREMWGVLSRFADAHSLKFAHGMTRGVLYLPEWEYVIKIGLPLNTNYNKQEAENFALAKKFRVEKVLLETTYLTTIQGIEVYKQPKYSFCLAEAPREFLKQLDKKSQCLAEKNIVCKICDKCYYDDISVAWVAHALQLYGKKFMYSFEKWTREAQVNDLHNGNVGWLDGKPILLDYAGY